MRASANAYSICVDICLSVLSVCVHAYMRTHAHAHVTKQSCAARNYAVLLKMARMAASSEIGENVLYPGG